MTEAAGAAEPGGEAASGGARPSSGNKKQNWSWSGAGEAGAPAATSVRAHVRAQVQPPPPQPLAICSPPRGASCYRHATSSTAPPAHPPLPRSRPGGVRGGALHVDAEVGWLSDSEARSTPSPSGPARVPAQRALRHPGYVVPRPTPLRPTPRCDDVITAAGPHRNSRSNRTDVPSVLWNRYIPGLRPRAHWRGRTGAPRASKAGAR